jgi:hypothetical protein
LYTSSNGLSSHCDLYASLMQAAILARFLSEGGVLDLHPDPRPCLDMTKNTPYETAVQQGHCTPFIMEALNPLTPASQLHRLCNKQLEKATAVVCLAPPGRQPDSPTRMLAIGECRTPGKVMAPITPGCGKLPCDTGDDMH